MITILIKIQNGQIVNSVLDSSNFTKEELKHLLNKYKLIFSDKPRKIKNFVAKLNINNREKFRNRSYAIPHSKTELVTKEI